MFNFLSIVEKVRKNFLCHITVIPKSIFRETEEEKNTHYFKINCFLAVLLAQNFKSKYLFNSHTHYF